MAREIKFRAWDYDVFTEKYEMRPFESIKNNCGAYFFNPEKYEPRHYLMQYTGLKDKNRVEIYEGDILTDGKNNFYIEYNTQNTGFWLMSTTESMISLFSFPSPLGNGYLKRLDLEVIGNIYENPELLQ